MADNSSLPVASGNETFANNDIGGVKYPRQKSTWGAAGTANDTDIASGKAMPVQLRSATGLIPIGEPTDAAATATDTTSVSAISLWKQISKTLQAAAGAASTALFTKVTDGTNTAAVKAASTAPSATDPALVVAMSPNTQNANGTTTDANSTPVAWSTEGKAQVGSLTETAPASDTASSGLNGRLQRIAQRITSLIALWTTTGLSNRAFVIAFATLTRPANTTAYTAADSISDNATAGSVTALVSGNISDTNDDPIFINEILVASTDTGLAGKKIRAYLFNSNPTSSSGVGAGDNAAYSQKSAGYIGSFMGWMETGFSDGTVGRLVPCFNETNNTQAGGFITVKPVSGARTLYIQYQAVEAFTPSANSTTIIGTARGWQGRAV